VCASDARQPRDWPFLVGGRFRRSDRPAQVRSPFDGEVVGTIFEPTDSDVEDAVTAAEAAAPVMAEMPAFRRAELLRAMANGVTARREELIQILALEAGKPRKAGAIEVDRAIFNFRYAAEEAQRIVGEVLPLDLLPSTAGRWGIVRRFPVGAVLAITPFNFPLNLVVHKLAPALAAGNSIVQKPAPQAPLCSMVLAEIAAQAGVPAGAVNVVPCSVTQAERLVRDDRLKLLSFTGSTEVGWKLKAMSGKKRVALELGGNAGVIIHEDADVDLAAARCALGGFAYAGQSCISVQRIFVHRAVYSRFLDRLLELTSALRVGDPLDENTDVGPLISLDHALRVESWVNDALSAGATAHTGARREGPLYFPTILTDTSPAMKVNCSEVFGPVVTVSRFDSFDEALASVDSSSFGLQAGVFTASAANLFRAFERLQVGAVIANDVPTFRADHMPYGGVKDSGLGREGVRYAIEEMSEQRLLVVNAR